MSAFSQTKEHTAITVPNSRKSLTHSEQRHHKRLSSSCSSFPVRSSWTSFPLIFYLDWHFFMFWSSSLLWLQIVIESLCYFTPSFTSICYNIPFCHAFPHPPTPHYAQTRLHTAFSLLSPLVPHPSPPSSHPHLVFTFLSFNFRYLPAI